MRIRAFNLSPAPAALMLGGCASGLRALMPAEDASDAAPYGDTRGRLTIYASPSDRALRLSQMLFRSMARLGQLTPDRISPAVEDSVAKWGNIDIVVYEGKRTDFFGHAYALTNPEVSADLIEVVRNGTPPDDPRRALLWQGRITWMFSPNDVGGRE